VFERGGLGVHMNEPNIIHLLLYSLEDDVDGG